MKTITNSLRTFALLALLMSIKSGSAQMCSASLTATQGANGVVNFAATSSPTTMSGTFYWTFGDGSMQSNTGPNVAHTYTANGTYVAWVMFMSSAMTCSASASQTIVVSSVNNNTCIANATYDLVPSGTAQLWYALPMYGNNVVAAQWSWGDGATSTGLFPSHQYAAAGNYSICLSVTVACGSSTTYCGTYNIYKGGSANMVQVNVIDPATVGLANIKNQDVRYTVSPNPGNGLFEINMNGLNSNAAKINVTDLVGKTIVSYDSEVSNNSIQKSIDLRNAPQGIYFINVTSEGQTYTKKIVLNK